LLCYEINEILFLTAFIFSYLSVINFAPMSSSRQLAAIMFTDIVGYTALMGEDEQKALVS